MISASSGEMHSGDTLLSFQIYLSLYAIKSFIKAPAPLLLSTTQDIPSQMQVWATATHDASEQIFFSFLLLLDHYKDKISNIV